MTEAVWNLLHDGEIVNIEGESPGDITLTVEIEYLRKMFSGDGSNIIIKLYGCDLLEYKPDITQNNTQIVEKNLDLIAQSQLWIYSGDQKGKDLIVYCQHWWRNKYKSGTGHLKLRYKDFSISLDNGKQVLLDELDKKAEQYWDNFEKRK